jgi:hypothetical protein
MVNRNGGFCNAALVAGGTGFLDFCDNVSFLREEANFGSIKQLEHFQEHRRVQRRSCCVGNSMDNTDVWNHIRIQTIVENVDEYAEQINDAELDNVLMPIDIGILSGFLVAIR